VESKPKDPRLKHYIMDTLYLGIIYLVLTGNRPFLHTAKGPKPVGTRVGSLNSKVLEVIQRQRIKARESKWKMHKGSNT